MTSIARNTRYTSDWRALVRAVKDSNGWTSAQLGEQVGAKTSTVSAWLSGAAKPGPEFAAKLTALAERKRATGRPTATRAGKGVTRPAGGPTRRLRATPGDSAVSRRRGTDDPVHVAIMSDARLPENARSALASMRLVLLDQAERAARAEAMR